jgi:hypothetical protein
MILALGDYTGPTPIYDYNGTLVDPNVAATAAQCAPFQCGAQSSNIAARLWCAFWGQAGARSACTDPVCAPYKPSYCTPPATAPPVVKAVAAPVSTVTTTTTTAAPAGSGGDTHVTVETPGGPVSMPAVLLPAVSDVTLTPAMVRIPNIWDSLDPSKISQFAYRGISTSFPVWISQQYRDSLAPASVEAPPMLGPGPGDIPWWVLVAIVAAMYMFSGRARIARRRKVGHHGK